MNGCGQKPMFSSIKFTNDSNKIGAGARARGQDPETGLAKGAGRVRLQAGQAKKGTGRMPWHWEPTKDVISCDKPR